MQVWEVTAQLIGLAGSVGLLRAIEATGKPENVVYVWAVNQVQSHDLLKLLSQARAGSNDGCTCRSCFAVLNLLTCGIASDVYLNVCSSAGPGHDTIWGIIQKESLCCADSTRMAAIQELGCAAVSGHQPEEGLPACDGQCQRPWDSRCGASPALLGARPLCIHCRCAHVTEKQAENCHSLAGVRECNERENILAWPSLARPSFTFATSLEDMLGVGTGSIGARVGLVMLSLGA